MIIEKVANGERISLETAGERDRGSVAFGGIFLIQVNRDFGWLNHGAMRIASPVFITALRYSLDIT